MSEHGPENWWSDQPPPGGSPPPSHPDYPPPAYEQPWQPHDPLLGAAEAMRDAAELMRDASMPAAPAKERNWDFSWFLNWWRYRDHGKACKRALVSSGPGFAFLLYTYQRQSHNGSGGMVVILVLLTALIYAVTRNAFSRWLMWGAALSPLFYPPALISFVFGTVLVLFGWK